MYRDTKHLLHGQEVRRRAWAAGFIGDSARAVHRENRHRELCCGLPVRDHSAGRAVAVRVRGERMDTRKLVDRWAADDYVLGSAAPELRRLRTISVLYRDATLSWLERAGIGDGMSVLDVGCGPGDVTLLAARLVGPKGAVIGLDSSPEGS